MLVIRAGFFCLSLSSLSVKSGTVCLRVVWFVGSTLAMVAWAAATRERTRASSLLVPFADDAEGMSDMSSGWDGSMLWMTSSSGTAPSGGCCGGSCAVIDTDGRSGDVKGETGTGSWLCV